MRMMLVTYLLISGSWIDGGLIHNSGWGARPIHPSECTKRIEAIAEYAKLIEQARKFGKYDDVTHTPIGPIDGVRAKCEMRTE